LDLQRILLREVKARIDAQIDYMREVVKPSSARAAGKGAARKRWAERPEIIVKARVLYAEFAARPGRVGKKKLGRLALCQMVADELCITPATVAEYVPNPEPENRGRPRK
jgi:hypothetical protein